MIDERTKKILLERVDKPTAQRVGVPVSPDCINSNCPRIYDIDMGYGVHMIGCKLHGWKENVASKQEQEVVGAGNEEIQ